MAVGPAEDDLSLRVEQSCRERPGRHVEVEFGAVPATRHQSCLRRRAGVGLGDPDAQLFVDPDRREPEPSPRAIRMMLSVTPCLSIRTSRPIRRCPALVAPNVRHGRSSPVPVVRRRAARSAPLRRTYAAVPPDRDGEDRQSGSSVAPGCCTSIGSSTSVTGSLGAGSGPSGGAPSAGRPGAGPPSDAATWT